MVTAIKPSQLQCNCNLKRKPSNIYGSKLPMYELPKCSLVIELVLSKATTGKKKMLIKLLLILIK